MDINRLVLLIRGREGEIIPGCCGHRELHTVEPTPEECEYIRDNICELLDTHKCDGLTSTGFDPRQCQCARCHVIHRKEGQENVPCPHAEYEIVKVYMWGFLQDCMFKIHDNTWRAILDGLDSLDKLDHCTKYHLFRCLDHMVYTFNRFQMVWDFLKKKIPREFADFKCCDKGCSRFKDGDFENDKKPIPIFKMYGYMSLNLYEKYMADYLYHRDTLGLKEPVQVVKVGDEDEDNDLVQDVEKVSREYNIDIVTDHMLHKAVHAGSIRCVTLFAINNPSLLKVYTVEYMYNFGPINYKYSPIIHYLLSITAHMCSIEKQREATNIIAGLVYLGADIHAPTIVDNVQIPTRNILEYYKYDYPKSPVMELCDNYDLEYDSSDKVKDAMNKLDSTSNDKGLFAYLRECWYIKDPTKFEGIAREILALYRTDWIAAGNEPPYCRATGIYDVPFISVVTKGIDNELSPDEIEKLVWSIEN